MMATVEKLEGLWRCLKVTIPAEEVNKAYKERFTAVSKNAQVAGFRPGKVPKEILERHFGTSVRQEVTSDLINRGFTQALKDQALSVASEPKFETDLIKENTAFNFTAKFEVLPEISLNNLSQIEIKRPVVAIQEQDIDEMCARLQKQSAEWHVVDRSAQDGDQVKIDFKGTVNGQPIEKGTAKDFVLELGSKRMIAGFETGIVGAKAHEQRKIQVKFPENYPSQELAGQNAEFTIDVHEVRACTLPVINAEFIKNLGIDSGEIQELRSKVAEQMQEEVNYVIAAQLKTQVLEKLADTYPIEIPSQLVDREIEHLHHTAHGENHQHGDACQHENFQAQAQKRVAMGLIVGEIIQRFQIKLDPQRVEKKLYMIARSYPGAEEKVIAWYSQQEQQMQEIKAGVMEEMAVEHLLNELKVIDEPMSYEEAVTSRTVL